MSEPKRQTLFFFTSPTNPVTGSFPRCLSRCLEVPLTCSHSADLLWHVRQRNVNLGQKYPDIAFQHRKTLRSVKGRTRTTDSVSILDMIWYKVYVLPLTLTKRRPLYIISYRNILVNCNWVVTRWQQYSTHLHTNSTQTNTMKQNTQNGTYIKIRIHKHNNKNT